MLEFKLWAVGLEYDQDHDAEIVVDRLPAGDLTPLKVTYFNENGENSGTSIGYRSNLRSPGNHTNQNHENRLCTPAV